MPRYFSVHSDLPQNFWWIPAIFITLFLASPLKAQTDSARVVAAGEEYAAGAVHRFLFGDLWRDVWSAKVRVSVLDLQHEAGGLTPLRRGGGFQTKSLRLLGGDGRQYKFRSIRKDPTKVLAPELRNTFVSDVLQDLISTANPYGALVAAPILTATGILHSPPRLVIMPDDEYLGEFRTEFANSYGTIEIHPDEADDEDDGFAGSDKVVGTLSLLEKLQKDTEDRAHAPSFLLARLLDIFMGDWDRHTDQWRWARFEEGSIDWWHPIPRDRDQAFCRYNGLIPWLATAVVPQLENCGDDYPQLQYLTYSGRHLDRRFLTGLDWSSYDSLLQILLPILNDSLLRSAVLQMPRSIAEEDGWNTEKEQLYKTLRHRRDALAEAAREYYLLLSEEASIYCSDEDEVVEVRRLHNGDVEVSAAPGHMGERSAAEAVFFRRTFHTDETSELRIYLEGGDDRCAITGGSQGGILVRVIGGSGKDHFIDSSEVLVPALGFLPFHVAGKFNLFYDQGGKSTFVRGPGTVVDRSDAAKPATLQQRYEPLLRDWGSEWQLGLLGAWNSDLGIMFGAGPVYTKYGFRADPYAFRMRLDISTAPIEMLGKANLSLDFRNALSMAELHFDAGISGFEVINYFGAGNETAGRIDDAFNYSVRQTQVFFTPSIQANIYSALKASFGASLRLVTSDHDDERLFLNEIQPSGYNQTTLLNLASTLTWDTRNSRIWPSEGLFLTVSGKYFPAILDQEKEFQSLRAEGRTYITLNTLFPWTLALRAGAQQVSDGYPFFEAAFIGGLGSARGYEVNRYAGDAMAYGGAEWRTRLFDFRLLFPSEFGMFCFAETGRVFLQTEASDRWHASWGGGIWVAPIQREFTFSASIGLSRHNTRFDLAAGFAF